MLRLLENVLAVGEDPANLVVYAALGKAARDWPSHDKIVETLMTMSEDETLVVQSGKPIGLLKTHDKAPIVIMANCNMVGQWAKAENFYDLQKRNLICWGGLTAGDWQYIGSQGVIQGTYEIFVRIAERHFNNSLAGRFILTAGLGGMGGSQPLAGRMAGAVILCVEIDEERIAKRLANGYLDHRARDLNDALTLVQAAKRERRATSIAFKVTRPTSTKHCWRAALSRTSSPIRPRRTIFVYGYMPSGRSLDEVRRMRQDDPNTLMKESRATIVRHVRAMLGFKRAGAVVFDNGNLIRTQARDGGVTDAFDIQIFTEAYLRPLFARAIGPFRWISLANDRDDIRKIDDYLLQTFPDNRILANWIALARQHVPFEGLPARIAWLGHGERTALALGVNRMVREGALSGPIAFTRDHLDAGAMAHPNIMTERMRDGSDAIADWPLLDAMAMCSSQADLVAIHSGGGGYSGYMTSAGVTVIADGTGEAEQRLGLALTNDTSLGVMRYADAGYPEAIAEARDKGINHFQLS